MEHVLQCLLKSLAIFMSLKSHLLSSKNACEHLFLGIAMLFKSVFYVAYASWADTDTCFWFILYI